MAGIWKGAVPSTLSVQHTLAKYRWIEAPRLGPSRSKTLRRVVIEDDSEILHDTWGSAVVRRAS